MKKNNKLLLAILSIYTVVLFRFLLHGESSIQSILFLIFIALVNLTVYYMLIKSNEKEIKVHLIVGKSIKKELMDQVSVIGSTQLLSLIFLEFIISNSTGTVDWFIVFWLLFILLSLLVLQILILWLFIRKVL
ncbi:hypothetical protein GCM10011482_22880 [Enterococcus alcedinis]|uniref:Uncharacterized protein n=1 Tax=Enterococcus alcedinis TaxID=1274384 RepID=A0A917N5Y9_9ENTE|nr:hypothetical protein GCM10011482_22880 [Enterococcus alcedinis]